MVGSTDFFEINLHDGDGNVLLGIDDGNTGQKLVFDIVNTSDKTIYFNKVEGFVNLDEINIPKNFHFSLLFRPKTLLSSLINKITLGDQEIKDGWVLRFIKREEKASDKYDIFYIANSQGHLLLPGDRITFTLNNISAAPDGGARGTRVEIKYNNFIFSIPNVDQNKDNKNEAQTLNILSGNCLKNLNILNQRGKKQVPLYVGFIGSNTILNDGSENTLTLSIQLLPRLESSLAAKSLVVGNSSDSSKININSIKTLDINLKELTITQTKLLQSINFIKIGEKLSLFFNNQPLIKPLLEKLRLTFSDKSKNYSSNYENLKQFLVNPIIKPLFSPINQSFVDQIIDDFLRNFNQESLKGVSQDELIALLSLLKDLGLPYQNLTKLQGLNIIDKIVDNIERSLSSQEVPLKALDEAIKFTISFDVANGNEHWALVSKNDADTIRPEIAGGSPNPEKWIYGGLQKQGITPQWSFICTQGLNLGERSEILQLKISNIKTRLLAGYANLYVHYENIPGYWDGHITVPIHKGPLVYREYPNKNTPNYDPKANPPKFGCVGIGTDKPQAKLHVKKDSSLPLALSVEGDTAIEGNLLVNNGRLGIGTSTLNKEPLVIRARGTQEGLIAFEDPNGNKKWHIEQNFNGNTPGLNFVETGVKDFRLFIKAGGNVGIGTSNPQMKLEVNGDISVGSPNPDTTTKLNSYGSKLHFLGANDNSDPVWIARYNYNSDKTSLRINLSDNGNADQDRLEVGYTAWENSTWNSNFYINSNGSYHSSDITLKKDINTVANSVLLVQQLRGVDFLWKHQKTDRGDIKKTLGLIAQEVEAVIPEIVDTNEDGLKFINYNGLIPVCIEAIKEQQNQINQLQQKLNDLTFFA